MIPRRWLSGRVRDGAGDGAACWTAALLALGALGAAVYWGAFVAGGSDSYCYVGQARMWVDGSILRPSAPGFDPFWSNAALSLAPTGFVPSPVVVGAIAPICPPGLAVMMAGAESARVPGGTFAIVPLSAALTVWCAFLLGRRLAGPGPGLVAALLTLASPTLLHQAFQPMSDVPATALWLSSLVLSMRGTWGASLGAGAVAGLAILVRPNLAPLAAPVALLAAVSGPDDSPMPRRFWRAGLVVLALMPGVAGAALLNDVIYGSALRSGYGDPSQLFSLRHVPVNLIRYSRWLVETHTPWPLLGFLAPILAGREVASGRLHPGLRRPGVVAVVLLAFAVLALLLYLPYVPFDNWSYLRFLLPGIVVMLALSSAAAAWILGGLPQRAGTCALLVLVAASGTASFRAAADRHVFDVRDSEARFVEAATWIDGHLPPGAIVFTVWHSGSVRYHGGRLTVSWDAIVPEELDVIMERLGGFERPPFFLLERWEMPAFRERFGGSSRLGALDWPPRAQVGRDVFVYAASDRSRYFGGEAVPSERVWTAAERRQFGRR